MDPVLYTAMDTDLRRALTAPHAGAPSAASRRERVYRALREELLSGAITPWDRLAEERVAAVYDVSRTPVREALARLRAEGLVEQRHGGLYLHLPAPAELIDLYELRVTLEMRGLQRADGGPTHDRTRLEQEQAFWVDLRRNPPPASTTLVTADERFHTTLLDCAGNPVLTEALRAVNQRIRPARMQDYLTEDRVAATIDEHLEIVESVLAGDLPAARTTLAAHIEASREVVMERAGRALEQGGVRTS